MVIESSGARVTRYSHNVGRVLKVPDQSVALLTALMLRGPQTAGELRINAERLHRFADISSVEAFLEELATRPEANGGALVVRLGRHPGEREQRWAHLLSGPVAADVPPARAAAAAPASADSGIIALRAEVERLSTEVTQLRAIVESLRRPPGQAPQ
jgi:uncharacterized protein YceH (UPF0502 family)